MVLHEGRHPPRPEVEGSLDKAIVEHRPVKALRVGAGTKGVAEFPGQGRLGGGVHVGGDHVALAKAKRAQLVDAVDVIRMVVGI